MNSKSNVTLFHHQEEVLKDTNDFSKVAYYLDMGLGKTFVGSEKLNILENPINIVVCQKTKVDDWIEHFAKFYPDYTIYDLTKPKQMDDFFIHCESSMIAVGVVNYELIFRRQKFLNIEHFSMLLDESSMIANENSKRSKFIHQMQPDNVILLSGTPTGGKYEKIWSQVNLLGWKISKKAFYSQYIVQKWIDDDSGFKKSIIVGYKNVDRLKAKLKQYGCIFMKTEEVADLPDMVEIPILVKPTKDYKHYMKSCYVKLSDGTELIGDTRLTKKLYARQLCGQYNSNKIEAFINLVESTDDRLIVFYNFDAELDLLKEAVKELDKPISIVNGKVKDLSAYDNYSNSITFIQYQAGAMGLNLQKANKIIYFTLPVWAELFEQSKKRIHRIGQDQTCFYYYLLCNASIELSMLDTLKLRKDYDDALFDKDVEINS
jgi:SNF2 family DNA or RNA helicase